MSTDLEKNITDIKKLLNSYENEALPHYINGSKLLSKSNEFFENISPINNEIIGSVASGGSEDINDACNAASAAFDEWKNISGKERKKLLHKIADGIEDRAREIALIESYDSGQAIRFMSKAAKRSATNFRFFAEFSKDYTEEKFLEALEEIKSS